MTHYAQHVRETSVTPQSEPILGSGQVPNAAGGFTWAVDDWKRLDRFLILGAEGGSYYATERELTVASAGAVLRCLKIDGVRLVRRVVEISKAGRAPKNDPALFVLALAAKKGDDATRREAYQALPQVARIGTHLFTFVENAQALGNGKGWGRGMRSAIARWYTQRDADGLAYQILKYAQRNGWSHRDLLRLAHPRTASEAHQALFARLTEKPTEFAPPALVGAFDRLQQAANVDEVVAVLGTEPKLSWEMIPAQHLGSAKVWEALLPNLKMTALIRNLARMTANGLIADLSDAVRVIQGKLADTEALRKERVHPISVLAAIATYRQGHGVRGQLRWSPVQAVLDALDGAFYASFGNVAPTGLRTLKALDVSGSMDAASVAGIPGLTAREASAAMAMVSARVEPSHAFVAFTSAGSGYGQFGGKWGGGDSGITRVELTPRMRLDQVVGTLQALPMGGTDCALPMLWAARNKVPVDLFEVYTDNETWAGSVHPVQALRQYRERMGIPAKLVVVATESVPFTIADPDDAGMLDVVGFDTATPQLISDFASE